MFHKTGLLIFHDIPLVIDPAIAIFSLVFAMNPAPNSSCVAEKFLVEVKWKSITNSRNLLTSNPPITLYIHSSGPLLKTLYPNSTPTARGPDL